MSGFPELHRRLAALAEIASDGGITQRSLAAKLDVSLGLANALLRELENDRLIQGKSAGRTSGGRYAVTRAGRGAMQRMSREFAVQSSALLRKARGRKSRASRRLSAQRAAEAKRGR